MSNITQNIRDFISEHTMGLEVENEEKLFQTGLVNSLFSLQIVNFIEKKYHIVLESAELNLKNFESINAISKLVEAKLG